ncbi:PREDICTED: uncharacterized protein LOC108614149 isoform X3 [Drosophila arizonae]|nr:PREDICTED: uncharacterized protein LOC108614149 isoform X3 [Drosophila arizonae]
MHAARSASQRRSGFAGNAAPHAPWSEVLSQNALQGVSRNSCGCHTKAVREPHQGLHHASLWHAGQAGATAQAVLQDVHHPAAGQSAAQLPEQSWCQGVPAGLPYSQGGAALAAAPQRWQATGADALCRQ